MQLFFIQHFSNTATVENAHLNCILFLLTLLLVIYLLFLAKLCRREHYYNNIKKKKIHRMIIASPYLMYNFGSVRINEKLIGVF